MNVIEINILTRKHVRIVLTHAVDIPVLPADHHMVNDIHIHEFCRLDQALRQLQVLPARFVIAGGVIVHQHDVVAV